MHFQEFNRGYPAGYLPRKNQAFSLLSGSRGSLSLLSSESRGSRRNSRSAEKEGRKENAGGRISVASLWMRRPGALVPAAAVACCAAVCKWWQDREACTEVVAGLCRAPFGLVPLNYRFAPPLHVQPCILCTRWPVYCASPALLPASKKADFGAPACDRATAGGKQASHAARAPAKQAG